MVKFIKPILRKTHLKTRNPVQGNGEFQIYMQFSLSEHMLAFKRLIHQLGKVLMFYNTRAPAAAYNALWPQDISKEFDLWLTLADPCMTFDLSNALCSGPGFFPPNLVAIGHCLAN